MTAKSSNDDDDDGEIWTKAPVHAIYVDICKNIDIAPVKC